MLGNDKIVAYSDKKFNSLDTFEGMLAVNPIHLEKIQFDCIVVTSVYFPEIKKKLMRIGIDSIKIISYENYILSKRQGNIRKYDAHLLFLTGQEVRLLQREPFP